MEIWHNPRCSKSRQALELLEEAGAAPDVRRYLEDPPTAGELRSVLRKLDLQPWELVRFGESVARELDLRHRPREDPEAWIALMAQHPRLIERPIVVAGHRAVVGRPPANVLPLT